MSYIQTLSDVCEFIIDCEHKTAPVVEHGIPSVRTTDLKNGRIILESCNRVSEETYKEWTNRLEPQPGDIILSREAPVGEVGIVPPNTKLCLGQRTVLIRLKHDQIDPRFLLYLFLTDEMRHELISRSEGSVVPHLNMSAIRSFALPDLPPLPTQHAIARILGSLDDKIELNRQMNETLEAMARAIFQSWFVDFDPVRAKAEGRDTGLPPEVAALFPDGFEEVDGREVPRGWGVSKIGNELPTLLGGTPSRDIEEFWQDGTIPWINSGKANEFRVIDPSEYITQSGVKNSATKMLPERTTIVAITGATLGQVSLLEISACANQSVIGVLGSEKISNEFVYFWIKTNIDALVSCQTGGAQQHINKNDVNDLELLIPDHLTLMAFNHQVKPIFDRIRSNCFESRTLAQIRDALLPKLMSGKVSVSHETEQS